MFLKIMPSLKTSQKVKRYETVSILTLLHVFLFFLFFFVFFLSSNFIERVNSPQIAKGKNF